MIIRKILRRLFHQVRYKTDKISNGLMDEYERVFGQLLQQPITLLEIGIFQGGSLHYWDKLFTHPETKIIGLDRNIPDLAFSNRVIMYECDQNDTTRLLAIAKEHGPFNIVIDDGAHLLKETRNCFDALFAHVRPGGYYAIEDWGVGYWSEQLPEYAGMVEMITEIMENLRPLGIGALQVLADDRCVALFQKETGRFEDQPAPMGILEITEYYQEQLRRL